MSRIEFVRPSDDTFGKPCIFWTYNKGDFSCGNPQASVFGRTECKGSVDEECLNLLFGEKQRINGELIRPGEILPLPQVFPNAKERSALSEILKLEDIRE